MTHLTQSNFDDTIATGKVFVEFGAAWCGYCRIMEPIIEKLAAEYEGRVVVGKVDAEAEPSLIARYDITTFPTFIVFEDSVAADRKMGAQTLEALERMIG